MSTGEKTTGISHGGLRLTSLTVAQMAKILSSASRRAITEEMISADIGAGAPTNPDGTVNLICYVSWLVREVSIGD